VITREQAADLRVWCLARVTRFALGWYWTPSQRADLIRAEQLARRAYGQHRRGVTP
jgi:hypothetical protein